MTEQEMKGSRAQKAEDDPMATAMKMMGEMGEGGGPMAVMQKMMAQMGKGGSPMECMMGMCTEMMSAMRQTNALAVFATPELQHVFGEWLKSVEVKAAEIVAKGDTDAASLAVALSIDEASANYILARLAASGSVTLTGKARR